MSFRSIIRSFVRDMIFEAINGEVTPNVAPVTKPPTIPAASVVPATLENKLRELLSDSLFEYRKFSTLVAETGATVNEVHGALTAMGATHITKRDTGESLYKLA